MARLDYSDCVLSVWSSLAHDQIDDVLFGALANHRWWPTDSWLRAEYQGSTMKRIELDERC